ncbi:indolepyruvate ferredoxin oxidoreductase family protein [Paraburkholderia sp. BCC1884]|uniref:indolepyruvate ferredoxin oxidoreductase family protein n=1 Tax=Paraburkholderia sp. BCC1884 TaxID=2562668 RepID=UPI0021B3B647|nr:indolepyruvate ferredoxin oxidoreductase family protein [Paraburkholderia sp. BCC1884]
MQVETTRNKVATPETTKDNTLLDVNLDDKYTKTEGRVYLSGIQALVRLPILQRLRDQAAGLNTAGYVSGYRGSPLGGYDEALWAAAKLLEKSHVRFQPGVNEELAATSVWGSQQVSLVGDSRYDGVFALWYGKGPGVDRCGDVFKHMNHAGTAQHGGVLLVAGDDHGAYSSTLPHQSEHAFAAAMIPVLYPANVEEYLTLGLHGWAMSRYAGCAVGFKALADTVESSASIDADPFKVEIKYPTDLALPEGGLNTRLSSDTLGVQARKQEALMQDFKIYAALAYARANHLNRVTIDSAKAHIGIVASGKSYTDVLEALEELGIDEHVADEIGLRVMKVAMPWPLEPEGMQKFADGLKEILVIEEKRQIVEYQLKEQLYALPDDQRPRIVGKFDNAGEWCSARGQWRLPAKADFSVAQIARVIADWVSGFYSSPTIVERMAMIDEREAALNASFIAPSRPAYYCSGCPHNSSTKVPDGSLALAGIGCHVMATAIYPEHNRTTTHMGGEGAPWVGQAPFSMRKHVFANLGDGTYFHSGSMAIRSAVAANVNITYKILYNDAVAMTGGQPVDGSISVDRMARQLQAEGVGRIVVVTEDLSRYPGGKRALPDGVELRDRSELDPVQRELRDVPGVTALIYDQTCAAEKRRRRKKKEFVDPDKRLFINESVCEGCGDCGTQSNCTSVMPLETSRGRKRTIDQSSCNKDYSCVKGFCPSFVTVKGGKLRSKTSPTAALAGNSEIGELPPAAVASCELPFNILINGIGGTGVITIGALLGMAAHLEGKKVSVLDMTGMSQKNGSVTSHVRISRRTHGIAAARIPTGEADLILGCDMLTSGAADALVRMHPGRTYALVNTHEQPAGHFAQQPDWQYPAKEVRAQIESAVGRRADFFDATAIATALMGDSIATNLFMLGYACQKGYLPVSNRAIERAIELNGVAVASNIRSFRWGRKAGIDLRSVERLATPVQPILMKLTSSLDSQIKEFADDLERYQNRKYADRYLDLVNQVRQAESQLGKGTKLTSAVSRYYYKLMAYKDEYEVARLFTDGRFKANLEQQFEGKVSLRFNLAAPLLSRKDANGQLVKREYGPWMWHALRLVAACRFLRGTAADPFGYTAERRMERDLIDEYRHAIEAALPTLSQDSLAGVVATASVPEKIRGFGHVKLASLRKHGATLHAPDLAPAE